MAISYSRLSGALEGAIAFYHNRSHPKQLVEREIEICRRIKGGLGDNVVAFYGTGYPFSAYYTIDSGNPILVQELVRSTNTLKEIVDAKGNLFHHCLSNWDEKRLMSPFRAGVDIRDLGYDNCAQCNPTIFELFYTLPDADLYVVVKRYPTVAELDGVESAGAELGFFPLYRNLEGVINSFAAGRETPTMHIDYMFVLSSDFVNFANNYVNGHLSTVSCLLLRYGRDSFRNDWLHIGIDAAFHLQPFAQYEPSVKAAFDMHLARLFSEISADEFLAIAAESDLPHRALRKFLQINAIRDSFRERHRLGRKGLITDIMQSDVAEFVELENRLTA